MKVVTPTQDSALPVVIAAKPSKTTVTAIQHAAQYRSSAKSDSMGCTLAEKSGAQSGEVAPGSP